MTRDTICALSLWILTQEIDSEIDFQEIDSED
jgi:hypothetical protein